MENLRLLLLGLCVALCTNSASAAWPWQWKWSVDIDIGFTSPPPCIHGHIDIAVSTTAAGPITSLSGVMSSLNSLSSGGKRSAESSAQDAVDYIMNSTLADMVDMLDSNRDGYLDVDEWRKMGSLKDFCKLLESYDLNEDDQITLSEIESLPFVVDPDVKTYMMMPMETYDDMMMAATDGQDNDEEEEGKGRKLPSE